jgi:hypothetical protein
LDINLNTLKRDIEEYLETAGFAIFRGSPGGLDDLSVVLWDVEQYPDYRMFLDAARKSGASMVVFGTRNFESGELEDAVESISECDMERAERREFESRLRQLRPHIGSPCALEMAFDYQGHMYVYEVTPDWYEEFLGIQDEISLHMPDEDAGGDSLDGYFSRN